jgi:hypothetical protein
MEDISQGDRGATLLAAEIKPQVAADCEHLVDTEVAEMAAITGAAVRLAYKTVRTFDAGHIRVMIDSLLPDVADALQPYWTEFTAGTGGDAGDFGSYLADREAEAAEALLAITDKRRALSGRATIVKAYNTVRGSAVKHVKAALPALGGLVQKYASILPVLLALWGEAIWARDKASTDLPAIIAGQLSAMGNTGVSYICPLSAGESVSGDASG